MSVFDQHSQQVGTQINIAGDIPAPGGCPKCNRIDRVEKVSKIFSDGNGPISHKFAPPASPEKPYLDDIKCGIEEIGQIVISLIIMGIGIYFGIALINEVVTQPRFDIGDGLIIIVIGVGIFVVLFGLGLLMLNGARKRINDNEKEYELSILPKWKKAKKHWEKAMSGWEKLYYCHRDDGIFDPDEAVLIPVDQMINYLYR